MSYEFIRKNGVCDNKAKLILVFDTLAPFPIWGKGWGWG